jgi:hypothetical protein
MRPPGDEYWDVVVFVIVVVGLAVMFTFTGKFLDERREQQRTGLYK